MVIKLFFHFPLVSLLLKVVDQARVSHFSFELLSLGIVLRFFTALYPPQEAAPPSLFLFFRNHLSLWQSYVFQREEKFHLENPQFSCKLFRKLGANVKIMTSFFSRIISLNNIRIYFEDEIFFFVLE